MGAAGAFDLGSILAGTGNTGRIGRLDDRAAALSDEAGERIGARSGSSRMRRLGGKGRQMPAEFGRRGEMASWVR